MTQCPLAYTDPCTKCAQYGNCSPSQAVQKLDVLENLMQELKQMMECITKSKKG